MYCSSSTGCKFTGDSARSVQPEPASSLRAAVFGIIQYVLDDLKGSGCVRHTLFQYSPWGLRSKRCCLPLLRVSAQLQSLTKTMGRWTNRTTVVTHSMAPRHRFAACPCVMCRLSPAGTIGGSARTPLDSRSSSSSGGTMPALSDAFDELTDAQKARILIEVLSDASLGDELTLSFATSAAKGLCDAFVRAFNHVAEPPEPRKNAQRRQLALIIRH